MLFNHNRKGSFEVRNVVGLNNIIKSNEIYTKLAWYVILKTYNGQEAKNDVERQDKCGNEDSSADEPPDN